MKFLILLALVAAASAATLNSAASERLNQEFRSRLFAYMGMGERADIIPPFNETQPINDTRIVFENELLKGHVELIGATAHDLHTLIDDIDFNLITLKASGTITLEKGRIEGKYDTSLVIHLPVIEPPFTNETIADGRGDGDLGAGGVTITFSATIIPNFITDRVHINNLSADVTITALQLFLQDLIVDGAPVDWDLVNQDAVVWFENLLIHHKPTLVQAIQDIANEILKNVKLSDIIGAIGK